MLAFKCEFDQLSYKWLEGVKFELNLNPQHSTFFEKKK